MKDIFKVKNLMVKNISVTASSHSLKETLKKMIDARFSQMPVVDEVGKITGTVSMESIVKQLYALNIDELNLKTDGFTETKVEFVEASADIFKHLDGLAEKNFVLIGDGARVRGLVTTYDLLAYFRKFSEVFLILHKIEELLRDLLKSCLSEKKAFLTARSNALKGPEFEKIKSIEDLTFDNYKAIITNKINWHYFKGNFKSDDARDQLNRLLESARLVRNDVCHFRNIASESEKVVLLRLKDFLEAHIVYA